MYIDLSVVIDEHTPVYPGDPATVIKPAGKLEADGYNDHFVSIGTHVGTHIDAPYHMIADGQTLDQFPVDQFVGRGRLIKLDNKEYDLQQLQKTDIREGDIVLFYSGMDNLYKEKAYFEDYPAMSDEVANYLVAKKVKMVGIDMCSPDHDEFTAHRTLLGSGVLIIENLTNLSALEGKVFEVIALPIKLPIDGAPARVIAKI